MPARSARTVLVIAIPLVFGMIGCCSGGIVAFAVPGVHQAQVTETTLPLPHHVPRYPGNLTLRFAMVHDVIHERFERHGPDYYRARNREVKHDVEKKRPTSKGKESDDYFRLIDDLCVGLAFLGKHSQAVERMRKKLDEQQVLGYKGRELYTTYANLGTILILWQLSEGLGDVPKAKKRIGESISWVRKSIEVYPQSHFGRERWQVVLEEFLLAVLDDPQLLLRYDMIGNRLDQPIDPSKAVCFDETKWVRSPSRAGHKPSLAERAARILEHGPEPEDPLEFRGCITRVGAELEWKEAKTSLTSPAPFDEPALGIVGMWRMGAGANPHFALALGEIMLRVGQRYIAWTAYERAYQLKEHYWADAKIQSGLGAHCRARQRLIEDSLPNDDWPSIRRRFEVELVHGQRFHKDYQAYEAKQIEEGTSISNQHFYDNFEAGREPIATPVDPEESTVARRERTHMFPDAYELAAFAVLFAGGFAFLAAAFPLIYRRFIPRRQAPAEPNLFHEAAQDGGRPAGTGESETGIRV